LGTKVQLFRRGKHDFYSRIAKRLYDSSNFGILDDSSIYVMENIYLKNVASIEHFESELSAVLVCSGSNFKNKAYLSKLIALFRNWEFEGKLSDYQSLLERFSLQNILTKDSRIFYESDMRRILFDGEVFEVTSKISRIDENIRGEEIFKKQVIDIVQEALNEGSRSKNIEYLYNKLSKVKVNIDSLVIIPSQRSIVSAFSEVFFKFKGTNFPLQNDLIDFIARWNMSRSELLGCILEPWDLEYRYVDNEDIFYKNNKFVSNLVNESADIQSVLPLKLVLEFHKTVSMKNQKTAIKNLKTLSFLIEEPELHLHLNFYQYIIQLIYNSCDTSVNDLIVATNDDKMASLIIEGHKNAVELKFDENTIVKL
jgi:hypothetical protein